MKKLQFIIYKIVNVANGKYYIGKHKTFELDDGYLGSGIAISGALRKYGKEAVQIPAFFAPTGTPSKS